MVHAPPPPPPEAPESPGRSTPATLLSVSALLSVLARKASHVSKKLIPHHHQDNTKSHKHHHDDDEDEDYYYEATGVEHEPVKSPRTPRTPLTRRPKELFVTMSNKAIKFVHGRKKGAAGAEEDVEEDFGDGGVWQKTILMGERCQPLDFSGVIYYDETGRKLDHVPLRSPRASPIPGYIARRNC